ncbi:MAG: TatD DNase family protein [Actinomycetota bacterium]|nr:TatD DNase family protein [Actinomycetota bacterium]
MWFDSHCHLHICEEDRPVDEVIAEARDAGVTELVTIGIDAPSNARSLELAGKVGVHCSVGIHPNSSTGWNDEAASSIEELLSRTGVVGVGETGLDFYRDWAPPADQERAFADHIAMAKRHDKALIIHTRESLSKTLDVLEEEGPPERFVMHCWSGTAQEMTRATEMGSYASFAGNVSFKNAANLRDVLPLVPSDRLLIETDSPYLTPEPFRGRPNSPAKVVHVGTAVAEVLGVEPAVVAAQTSANARRFFALG